MKRAGLFLLLVVAAASACVPPPPPSPSERYGNLYPANDRAREMGPRQVAYRPSGNGGGAASIALPSGEILRGEYRTLDGGSISVASGSATTVAVPRFGTFDRVPPDRRYCGLAECSRDAQRHGGLQWRPRDHRRMSVCREHAQRKRCGDMLALHRRGVPSRLLTARPLD